MISPNDFVKTSSSGAFDFLAGGGEMGERIRNYDWSRTPLGPPETWSPALRTLLSIMLANRFPQILWWGPEFIQFYNDAYRPIPGTKHPHRVLGQPAHECWEEIWEVIGPLIERPFRGGEATWDDDILLEVRRHGFVEETHFTIAYSPVPDQTVEGHIGGVLATVHEITGKVITERRINTLRELGTQLGGAKTAGDVCAIAARVLGFHERDIPFALLYLVDPQGRSAQLAGVSGVPSEEPIHRLTLDLSVPHCPCAAASASGTLQVIEDLAQYSGSAPRGPWSDPPSRAVVVPVPSSKADSCAALLIAGVSARLRLDQAYRDFFDLLKTQIATALNTVRALEEEKRRSEELAALDRAKTAFFSNVSHEFRTPLTLILGPVEELLAHAQTGLASPVAESLNLVGRNARRLLRLVNTLLDFSRIEAGRVQAAYVPTDIATFSAGLASVFRSAIEKAGLRLVVDCPPLGELAWVDRDMWEKIVLNLLSNALKFTFEGEIAVSLRLREGCFELKVRDTGVGIPAEAMPRLFERFHRVDGTRGRAHEGTGIGLALVQELARLHGGAITAESEIGKGTTFTVTLLRGKEHLPMEHVRAEGAHHQQHGSREAFVEEALLWLPQQQNQPDGAVPGAHQPFHTQSSSGDDDQPHILLADDNADMRGYVARLLSTRYHVESVPDGLSALEAARHRRPDLVLSDVMMPGLDGIALTRELRADPTLQSVPVVLLSARAGEESRVEGLGHGADDYLIKPFGGRELIARVEANLSLARVRNESERRVREAVERLNDATEAGGVGIWRVDLITGLATRDASMNRILGLQPVESTQPVEDFFSLVAPADRERVREGFRKAIDGTDIYETEMRILRPDGSVRWLRDRGRIVRSADGTPVLATGAAADISEMKRVEAELASANAVMRAVAENSTDLVYVKDSDSRLIYLNPATCRMLGGKVDDFVGKNAIDLAGDTPQAHRILENDRRVIAGEDVATFEETFTGPDGVTRIFHSVKTRWVDEDGKVLGLVAISRDITARKRAEEELRESEARFRALADDTPVFIWQADADINITYANRPFLEFLELKDVSEFTGRAWESRLHPDDVPLVHRVYSEAVRLQKPYTLEIRHRILSTGEYEWNFFKGVPRFVGGQFAGFIGTGVNINELKTAEAKLIENEEVLRAAKERAEAASRAKDKFLAQLSHELRTPLTPVLMTAAALSEDATLPAEVREQLAMIQRNVALEARLIDDLLDLTRITHGKLTLHAESCDANRMIELAVDIVREEARQKRIHLTADLQAKQQTISGDPARLQQVIWNLLRNAVKFTPAGGHVRVTSRRGQRLAGCSEPASLLIEVSDTGIGFSSEFASCLFEPFEQGNVAGDQRFPGLGLGLAIARAIIEMHHGTITATSEGPGKGATFTVALPMALEESAGHVPVRRESDSASEPEEPLRILLVDDHETTRNVLARLLRRAGHDVITAADVRSALSAAERATFDVVLSDIGLPDGTGFDLMAELRSRYGLRGIALSGYGTDEDLRDSAEAGFVEHLVKPATIQEVRQALRRFAASCLGVEQYGTADF